MLVINPKSISKPLFYIDVYDQFGRGDHGRLGYGRKVTTGQPLELPIDIPPPEGRFNHTDEEDDGKWIAKHVACGGRHTLAIVEWKFDQEGTE